MLHFDCDNSQVSPETEPILSPQTKENAKEWTKFIDSPTSSVSSPGPKPVNFDFQKSALDKDPKILHPVALRLTPECANLQGEEVAEGGDSHSPKRFVYSFLLIIDWFLFMLGSVYKLLYSCVGIL